VFSLLGNAVRVPGVRKRPLFTFLVLALYRLGSWIPAPGVDSQTIKDYFNGRGGTILGLLRIFSGGALSRFALFALGIMPYVTASIILQLMTVVVPKLEALQKEGESGYAKINQYTRYLTVALAALQALGYGVLFQRQGIIPHGMSRLVLIVIPLTAGTTLLMWMGELITKRGIGNGISLLIFPSIISRLPTARKPVDQADNLRKQGGYIPGIRPGPSTAAYLDRVLTRLTLPGALFLAAVAVLPTLFIKYFNISQASRSFLGGTSVLIAVGVALDTMRQMESQMMMRRYEGFLR